MVYKVKVISDINTLSFETDIEKFLDNIYKNYTVIKTVYKTSSANDLMFYTCFIEYKTNG